MNNPFEHTQAKDLSDDDIGRMWVELPANGFAEMARPHSPMPVLLLGSKGSGKTHLLRYASFPLQVMRHPAKPAAECVADEGYVGIYLSCQGLNASRFYGRGFPPEQWQNVFPVYFDLWLAETILPILREILEGVPVHQKADVVREYAALCGTEAATIDDLRKMIAGVRRDVDRAVHSAASRPLLDIHSPWNWGELVFGLPEILVRQVESLKQLRVLYLIDEFESLLEGHQLYVNTLMRERRAPVSFRVGARLHGIRTYLTLSAGEPLRHGSEFERLNVDARLRKSRGSYKRFAADLVRKRIGQHAPEAITLARDVSSLYPGPEPSRFASADARQVAGSTPSRERPHMVRLRNYLISFGRNVSGGRISTAEVDEIVRQLSVPDEPLLEKSAVFVFYKRWASGAPLLSTAADLTQELQAARAGDTSTGVARQLRHFGKDLMAQLYRENSLHIDYSGFNSIVGMSMGIPRHLLMVLKYVHSWSVFRGEDPYANPISRRAQNEGIREAAEWFFEDSKLTTGVPPEVHFAVDRLATLLRGVRFSDKPSECSVAGVSIDGTRLTKKAGDVISAAAEVSLLIPHMRGQRDRNSVRIDAKYRLNYMLCPRWDLPIASRGVLPLSPDLVRAIFDPDYAEEFDDLMAERTRQMNAPFSATSATRSQLPLDLR